MNSALSSVPESIFSLSLSRFTFFNFYKVALNLSLGSFCKESVACGFLGYKGSQD